jgi:hypothetical protein
MASYDEYLKKIKAAQAGNVAADIAALNQAKDAEAKIYTDNYNQQIADTAQSYENAFRQNELQRDLNERYLERKAAEMGLTDSGMNRTQLTANQLSYANQKGNLTMQKQKAIDTLASALQAKIAGVEAEKVTGAQQIRSSYDSAASEQATSLAKADIEAQATPSNVTRVYDSSGNVINTFTKDERKDALSSLSEAFGTGTITDLNQAAKMIDDFGSKYDLSDAERINLLALSGLTQGAFETWLNTKNVYMSPSDYNMAKRKGNAYGFVDKWDYKKDGELRYYFKITKATNNWGGKNSVDNDDRVTIYYPDMTVVAEDVRIDQLPENIRQDITNRTAGKKKSNKDYDFYYTADLNGSTF